MINGTQTTKGKANKSKEKLGIARKPRKSGVYWLLLAGPPPPPPLWGGEPSCPGPRPIHDQRPKAAGSQ